MPKIQSDGDVVSWQSVLNHHIVVIANSEENLHMRVSLSQDHVAQIHIQEHFPSLRIAGVVADPPPDDAIGTRELQMPVGLHKLPAWPEIQFRPPFGKIDAWAVEMVVKRQRITDVDGRVAHPDWRGETGAAFEVAYRETAVG